MKNCLFLDRDGTINKNYGYIGNFKKFVWLKYSKKAIKYAYKKGFLIVVISNQSGVSRGYFSEEDCLNINKKINSELKKIKCKIHDFYYSFYHPKFKNLNYDSKDRKPNIGMIIKAKKKWNIDLKKSYMIGDEKKDQKISKKLGIRFKLKRKNLFYEVKSLIG